ncbi:hypothetical protein [Halochromatium sp.]
MNSLEQRILSARPVLDALCQAMRREAATLFPREPVMISSPTAALYRLQHDPADGSESLVGEWLNAQGHRLRTLVCHASGHCFAEHDIVRGHPHDPRWFVEAVEAWGLCAICTPGDSSQILDTARPEDRTPRRPANGAEIQAELRLLPQP